MEQATTIGLDIAKHVFQLHGADAAGHVLFRKRITRVKLLGFLAAQTRCVVAMAETRATRKSEIQFGQFEPVWGDSRGQETHQEPPGPRSDALL